jgi:hypothetical protein
MTCKRCQHQTRKKFGYFGRQHRIHPAPETQHPVKSKDSSTVVKDLVQAHIVAISALQTPEDTRRQDG